MNRDAAVCELRRLIHALLRGELGYAQFERDYISYFMDTNADAQFTDDDHQLYGVLFERLQWTGRSPSRLDRAVGYYTEEETLDWLRARFADLA